MKPGQGTSYLRPRTSFPFPSVYRHSRIVSPPLYFRLETNCGQIFPISNDSQRWLAKSIPSRLFLEQVRPFYRFVYIKRAYRNRIGNQQFSSSFLNQGISEGWKRRWTTLIEIFSIDVILTSVEGSSLNPYPRRNEEKSWRQALDRWELCASRGQVEMTWNDERSMRRMTGKQKKATIWGNLGAVARDPRASSNSRDRLSRLCATVWPATASSRSASRFPSREISSPSFPFLVFSKDLSNDFLYGEGS